VLGLKLGTTLGLRASSAPPSDQHSDSHWRESVARPPKDRGSSNSCRTRRARTHARPTLDPRQARRFGPLFHELLGLTP
jgi:hypothetical protein